MSDPRLPTVTCQLQMQNTDTLFDQILSNAKVATHMVQRHTHTGKTLIVCGAGPSLATMGEFLRETKADEVWGCNSALPYLRDQGWRVTHGFCVDQGEAMLGAYEWQRTFPVTYLVATSIHPTLTAHLRKANRPLVWFHNYLGIKNPEGWTEPAGWVKVSPDWGYEMYLYQTKFPPSVQVGYGLNSVVRAVCLAMWMDFAKIYVVGADSAAAPDVAAPMPLMNTPAYDAWLQTVPLYANGRTAYECYGPNAVLTEGLILGRRWVTRTDMLISAQHLVDVVKNWGERIVLVGDTLPNALLGMPKDYLDQLPKLAGGGQVTGFAIHKDLQAQLVAALDNPEGDRVC